MAERHNEEFDYIVVGGGLAGCVVAARLSEDPRLRVLLLEAGGENIDERSYFAAGVHDLWPTQANWAFKTAPQAHLGGLVINHPRGRVIGGSAAINVGSWSRGIPADYDRWAAAGATGWGWETALQAFRMIEASSRSEIGGRGKSGPLRLENTPTAGPMVEAFRQACIEAGIGQTDDHNGAKFEGFDRWETIFPNGRRRNTAEAYLATARTRANLSIVTGALVTRVLIEGARATGIAYERDGAARTVAANAEVILCAGAFMSPHILMLSGIGPADHLREHGIAVALDSPGVGANLIDHMGTSMGWAARKPGGIAPIYADHQDPEQLRAWRHTGYGRLADNENPCIAFTRSSGAAAHADIELLFHVVPPLAFRDVEGAGGFSIIATNVDPVSRGHVRLASGNARDLPIVDPNYLSDEADLTVLTGGVQRALSLARTKSLSPYAERHELASDATEREIADRIRSHPVSMYHPVGTARMGRADDRMAVLDPELRVKGVDRLRVVDASAMPSTVRGHTMAPVVYIAERACGIIGS